MPPASMPQQQQPFANGPTLGGWGTAPPQAAPQMPQPAAGGAWGGGCHAGAAPGAASWGGNGGCCAGGGSCGGGWGGAACGGGACGGGACGGCVPGSQVPQPNGMPWGGGAYGAPCSGGGAPCGGVGGGMYPAAAPQAGGGCMWQAGGEVVRVNVEVMPELHPEFMKGNDFGTYVLQVPRVITRLQTSCNPALPIQRGMLPFKPYEEFDVILHDARHVIFNEEANQPPDGRCWCQVQKRGAVMEFPQNVTIDAKLKTNSPYGSVVLEDYAHQQRVGETVLNWRLQVTGQLGVSKGTGNLGANRLEVEITFLFDCYMGGPPVAQS
eukprot:TRINITY_DN4894_c4_g1_i1.p1 TRINITY_DN4894_c4_g1~~TRINITY_DN4894_c4_g1_i1.p1  ORF type:complete len:363 (+),score=82.53 TRINITY_DN4894_c4_g1_i1:120-1091(+)